MYKLNFLDNNPLKHIMARMAEFPDHHTTAVSVKTQETTVETSLRFDISYIKQRDGILKVAEIVSIADVL